MRVVLAGDHAGYGLKSQLAQWLRNLDDVHLEDLGTSSAESVDYPDFAEQLCGKILSGEADMGILICNSGVGMSMAANRFKGIRAALCLFPDMAYWARHHNNANVLVLGAGITALFQAKEITGVFLSEEFDGGRHQRRTEKMDSF